MIYQYLLHFNLLILHHNQCENNTSIIIIGQTIKYLEIADILQIFIQQLLQHSEMRKNNSQKFNNRHTFKEQHLVQIEQNERQLNCEQNRQFEQSEQYISTTDPFKLSKQDAPIVQFPHLKDPEFQLSLFQNYEQQDESIAPIKKIKPPKVKGGQYKNLFKESLISRQKIQDNKLSNIIKHSEHPSLNQAIRKNNFKGKNFVKKLFMSLDHNKQQIRQICESIHRKLIDKQVQKKQIIFGKNVSSQKRMMYMIQAKVYNLRLRNRQLAQRARFK